MCQPGSYERTISNPVIICNGNAEDANGFRSQLFVFEYGSQAEMNADARRNRSVFSSATCLSPDGAVTIFNGDVSGIGSKRSAAELAERGLRPLREYGCTISEAPVDSPSTAPPTTHPTAIQAIPTPTRMPNSTGAPIWPPAAGTQVVNVTTRLQWGGTRCIGLMSARRDDRTRQTQDRICSDEGTWRYTEHASSGQLIGGDPIMGDADWIACQVYFGDRLEYSDRAEAGDGTDVNCLRKVN